MRILLLGDAGAGKTTFMNNIEKNDDKFIGLVSTVPTYGLDVVRHNLIVGQENHKITFMATSGLSQFNLISNAYISSCVGYIIFIDTTNIATLKSINQWLCRISSYGGNPNESMIIGTKKDLYDKRKIKKSDIASLYPNVPYFEVDLLTERAGTYVAEFLSAIIRRHKNSCSIVENNREEICFCQ